MLDRPAVIVITPDMVGGNHEWHEIDHWKWPLWKCQRCKMQTKSLVDADARPCLPTKTGWCRICHQRGYSKTSLYCRRHRNQAWNHNRHNRVPRVLTDDQLLDLKRQGKTLKDIGTQLGVSPQRAGQIIRDIEASRHRQREHDLEDRLGPCACGSTRIWIFDHPGRPGSVVCSGCRTVRLETPPLESGPVNRVL